LVESIKFLHNFFSKKLQYLIIRKLKKNPDL
jgi:hypothetical protein